MKPRMGIYSPKTVPTLCSRYILIGVIMEDVGKVSEAKTHKLNAMYVYHSVRQPGYVYEFCALKKDKYRCVRCHRVGKSRYVTIRNAAVVPSTKHPEDDHVCEPITLEGTSLMCTVRIIRQIYGNNQCCSNFT